ncbi:MAG: hypothetical protein EPN50_10490 [Chloroflexota bacterium]|nr:MAG: hypothetical protein EPN50_10490 [Chloroflexota bacterium]
MDGQRLAASIGRPVKVVLECGLLTDDEKRQALSIAAKLFEDAVALLEAGASRLGTSRTEAVLASRLGTGGTEKALASRLG